MLSTNEYVKSKTTKPLHFIIIYIYSPSLASFLIILKVVPLSYDLAYEPR